MEQESTNLDFVSTGSFDESDSSHDDFIVRSLDLNEIESSTVVLKSHNPLHAPTAEIFPPDQTTVSHGPLDKANAFLDSYMKNKGKSCFTDLFE